MLLAPENRIGTITAKATFRIAGGRAELETQDPMPLLFADAETDLGILPGDVFPRRDNEVFEVLLFGAAYSANGNATHYRRIEVAVGDELRALDVSGRREWRSVGGEEESIAVLSPFVRMPLIAANAFGGKVVVEVDREAFLDVSDLNNPEGKGLDAEPLIRGLADAMKCPVGYPRYVLSNELPSVERPSERIVSRGDRPLPAFWSALPIHSGIHGLRSIGKEALERGELEIRQDVFHRAHPDWVIPRPRQGALVRLDGLSPAGAISFPLPELRVLVDWVCDGRAGTLELEPHLLALLPEERRCYIVYRKSFEFDYSTLERSMRLRLASGWCSRN